VSIDTVGMSSVSIARIRQLLAAKTSLTNVELVVSATHTHHAPDTMGLWGALPYFTKTAGIGQSLFNSVGATASTAQPLVNGEVDATSKAVSIPVNNQLFSLATRGFLGGAPVLEAKIVNGRIDTQLTRFRIGELGGVTVPGEIFASGSVQLKQMLKVQGRSHALVVGLGQDWLGYLMSPQEYDDESLSYNRGLSPSREAQVVVVDAYRQLLK
jgi:hypothetical protein